MDANYKDKQGLSLLHLVPFSFFCQIVHMHEHSSILLIIWCSPILIFSVGCSLQSNWYSFHSHGFGGKPGVQKCTRQLIFSLCRIQPFIILFLLLFFVRNIFKIKICSKIAVCMKILTDCFLFRRNTFRLCTSYIAIQNAKKDGRRWHKGLKHLSNLLLLLVVFYAVLPKEGFKYYHRLKVLFCQNKKKSAYG